MKKGFTLIELLIVVAVIGIIAVALLPTVSDAPSRARDTAKISKARDVIAAIEAFHADHQRYPSGNFCIGPVDDDPGPSADEAELINDYLNGEVPVFASIAREPREDVCDTGSEWYLVYITDLSFVDDIEGLEDPPEEGSELGRSYVVAVLLENERDNTGEITVSGDITVWGYVLPEMR